MSVNDYKICTGLRNNQRISFLHFFILYPEDKRFLLVSTQSDIRGLTQTTDAFPALPYPRVTRPSSVDYYIDGDGQGHLFWVGGDPMTSFASQSVYTSFVNGTGVQKLLDSEKGKRAVKQFS